MILILTTLILFSFVASLICLAVHNIFVGENMLLSEVGERLEMMLPFWMCKVFFSCLPCMASFWGITLWLGTAVLFPFFDISLYLAILLTPAVVLMISGINVLFETVIFLVRHLTTD